MGRHITVLQCYYCGTLRTESNWSTYTKVCARCEGQYRRDVYAQLLKDGAPESQHPERGKCGLCRKRIRGAAVDELRYTGREFDPERWRYHPACYELLEELRESEIATESLYVAAAQQCIDQGEAVEGRWGDA